MISDTQNHRGSDFLKMKNFWKKVNTYDSSTILLELANFLETLESATFLETAKVRLFLETSESETFLETAFYLRWTSKIEGMVQRCSDN